MALAARLDELVREGVSGVEALVRRSCRRLRPVFMAAAMLQIQQSVSAKALETEHLCGV